MRFDSSGETKYPKNITVEGKVISSRAYPEKGTENRKRWDEAE